MGVEPRPEKAALAALIAVHAGAFVWGVAEATVFFIVPDVLLTALALWSFRRGLAACGWATAGALCGGLLMYWWGSRSPERAEVLLDWVPAVSPQMIEDVREGLAEGGLRALFFGPLKGTPYKIYAVESGRLGLNLAAFLLVSAPARLARFLILASLAGWLARGPLKGWTPRRRTALVLFLWTAFYVFFFALMPG